MNLGTVGIRVGCATSVNAGRAYCPLPLPDMASLRLLAALCVALLAPALAQTPPSGSLPNLPLAAADFQMLAVNNVTYAFFATQTSYYAYKYAFWRGLGDSVGIGAGAGAAIEANVFL